MLGRLSFINTQPKEVFLNYLLIDYIENYIKTFLLTLCKILPSQYKTFFPGWQHFGNVVSKHIAGITKVPSSQ